MFTADLSQEQLAEAIVGHVICWNATLLGGTSQVHGGIPAWHAAPNGERYLTDDLAPDAARRLHARWKKKRWHDFVRYLSRLAIHVRGRVVRKAPAMTAAHVIDSLLDDFGWGSKGSREQFRQESAVVLGDTEDPARVERLTDLILASYMSPA